MEKSIWEGCKSKQTVSLFSNYPPYLHTQCLDIKEQFRAQTPQFCSTLDQRAEGGGGWGGEEKKGKTPFDEIVALRNGLRFLTTYH